LIIEPERFFIQAKKKVEWFNADVCSLKAAFEQAPKVFHPVRVNIAALIFFRVADCLMNILPAVKSKWIKITGQELDLLRGHFL
jgi:hypothetical protein